MKLNCDAIILPPEKLLFALKERIHKKKEILARRDAELGAERIRITSYMENIGWPELFGFDMNDFFAKPDLSLEMQLREKIFWADNSDDDSDIYFGVEATTGMYFDSTLFGQKILHTTEGIPQFYPHPISQDFRLSVITPFDFYHTGDMPRLISNYLQMKELSQQKYSGQITVSFPNFHRGPLDIFIQMRGYESFIDDTFERPDRVRDFLNFIVDERRRFAHERCKFLGETGLPLQTYVADDWVNIPFISPTIFHDLIIPAYRRIADEGMVMGFHTCGKIEAVIGDILDVFPDITCFEVSGWNNIGFLDEIIPRKIAFNINLINTFTLLAPEQEQHQKLQVIAAIGQQRKVSLCAQAIVKLCPTYDETLGRMNRFIELARQVFSS